MLRLVEQKVSFLEMVVIHLLINTIAVFLHLTIQETIIVMV
jgi:hypothetical protein